jgi:hypothetical protein
MIDPFQTVGADRDNNSWLLWTGRPQNGGLVH